MKIFRSIRGRVLYGTLLLALLPLVVAAVVVAYLGYQSASQSLTERAQAQLQSIQAVKRDEVGAYLESLQTNLRVIAANPAVLDGMVDLVDTFASAGEAVEATVEEQRQALKQYYGQNFVRQFQLRNPGSQVEMAALVDELPDQAVALQYQYIAANPNPLGEKGNLNRAPGLQAYHDAHARLHPYMREVVQRYGYYDIFLMDADTGNVVYTYYKELDFATSLVDGLWAGTGLSEAFLKARDAGTSDAMALDDYRTYRPSYDDQAAFFAMPLVQDGQVIGILAAQAPIDRINDIANFRGEWEASGLGASGDLSLVGPDLMPRAISRNMLQSPEDYLQKLRTLTGGEDLAALVRARNSDVGLVQHDSPAVRAALRGETGSVTYTDGFGEEQLAAYGPLTLSDGTRWAVVSEIRTSEALAPVAALLRQQTLAAGGIAVLLAILAGLIANRLARSINQPVSRLSATVQQLSGGNMDARVQLQQQDELGDLGRALDDLLDERVATLSKAAAENEQLNESVIQIMQAVTGLAQNDLTVAVPVTPDITGAVSDAINLLTKETSSALRKVLAASRQVTEASQALRGRTDVVLDSANANEREVQAAATELKQAADALATVATQAEGARSRAEEALRASSQGLRIVSETVEGVTSSRDQIRETEKRVKRLAERSQEINGVVNIINQIAERTAVLALNAGMQAAAAGDAGRGFAVVADEVKRLADSARGATAQIGTLVGGIQADAADTMRAMNESLAQFVSITRLAERAGEEVQSSMSATDGLASAVREIAESSSRQARISGTLVERAQRIDQTTRQTLDEVQKQKDNVQTLLDQANSLASTVGVFKLPGSA